jgi:hypothetical protein
VGFDVLTTCQPSTVWWSRERLPAAAAQPAQGSSEPVAPRIYLFILNNLVAMVTTEHKQSKPIVLQGSPNTFNLNNFKMIQAMGLKNIASRSS